ncbi:hypothetical protein M407DRAFT_163264 [Tulasnella calospora MUT 4182]|uniref:Uncharacterized protein n=1 Tax=Tulasnella calospora MUT 4182 TaxID=1051891 RepID=A0A0C3QEQ0_9AGAM|nr:hypothetical protein M407DRAFT_163264 [Tulasnella calospora MUT 4182]
MTLGGSLHFEKRLDRPWSSSHQNSSQQPRSYTYASRVPTHIPHQLTLAACRKEQTLRSCTMLGLSHVSLSSTSNPLASHPQD